MKLIVDPGSSAGIAEALGTWMESLERQHIDTNTNIVCIYDVKLAGHASARCHLRTAPFRQAHYERMIKGAMEAMTKGQKDFHMPDKICVCCFDGGSHGLLAIAALICDFGVGRIF